MNSKKVQVLVYNKINLGFYFFTTLIRIKIGRYTRALETSIISQVVI